MTDHRATALINAETNPMGANIHALVFLGDQVKRIADALDGAGKTQELHVKVSSDADAVDLGRILARKGHV